MSVFAVFCKVRCAVYPVLDVQCMLQSVELRCILRVRCAVCAVFCVVRCQHMLYDVARCAAVYAV